VQSFLANFFDEEWAKFIPPITNCFVADVDASLMAQIFYISKR